MVVIYRNIIDRDNSGHQKPSYVYTSKPFGKAHDNDKLMSLYFFNITISAHSVYNFYILYSFILYIFAMYTLQSTFTQIYVFAIYTLWNIYACANTQLPQSNWASSHRAIKTEQQR